MKTKHLFWGFLFLTLGTLILINNFTPIEIYLLDLWQFWPLFLIAIGISLLIKQDLIRAIFISVTAIVLGFAIFSTFKIGWGYFHDEVIVDFRHGINIKNIDDDNLETHIFEEEFNDSIKYAALHFQAGAGAFRIKDTSSYLFTAITKSYDNNYKLKRYTDGANVNLNFKDDKDGFLIFRGKNKNRVNISLNQNPVWKLNFDIGAAASEFDLRNYKVEELIIDIGAASSKIYFGELQDSVYADIDAGASSVEILIPESAGCQVNADIFLSSRKLEGFNKVEDDLYRTENFESSDKKIYINIDTGISSIKIKRYSDKEW